MVTLLVDQVPCCVGSEKPELARLSWGPLRLLLREPGRADQKTI